MTTFQLVSLGILAVVAAILFLPNIRLPIKAKPSTLKHIESVIGIRDSSTNPEVQQACQALLQALLK